MIQLSTQGRDELASKDISPRELDSIIQFLVCKDQEEMAMKMFVVTNSLKFHMTNIYRKLGVQGSHGLWQWLIKNACIEGVKIEVQIKETVVTKEVIVVKETRAETLPTGKAL